MGFLDNSSITVDAILTKKGRRILSQGGNFKITKFALSDEEIDYTLYDVTHPDGTDSYGSVIENMSLLEAAPNRTDFNSFLVDGSMSGTKLVLDSTSYTVDNAATIAIKPTTQGGSAEQYKFSIENTNIVKFSVVPASNTATAASADLIAQSINQKATTTVTVTGMTSGLTKVITITVNKDVSSNVDPSQTQDDDDSGGGNGSNTGNGSDDLIAKDGTLI